MSFNSPTRNVWKATKLATATTRLAFLVAITPYAEAQLPATVRPEFEVASVRANKSGPPVVYRDPFVVAPGGRFTATNVTLADLIIFSYHVPQIQIQGGPRWFTSDRFDVIAKADANDGELRPRDVLRRVQSLLEDRFKLILHRTMRVMNVLALTVGSDQPRIQESGETEGEPNVRGGERGQMYFHKQPVVGLTSTMANILNAPVVDRTGLSGRFDFTLDPVKYASPTPGVYENYGDLLLTAVREQLGFKVERQKASLEILVIDHVERPTEN
jgi:uncharacterized protein (TIGR03435 family)